MNLETKTKIEAAVLQKLLKHLDDNKDVQNIDLMILANFCRNCLSKWYQSSAAELGEELSTDQAREVIYGMPYEQWKEQYQTEASAEQLAAMQQRKKS